MDTKLLVKIVIIAALVIVSCFYAFPLQEKINLGLDLQGGMHLVLQVDTSGLPQEAKQDAPERVLEIIRNRIDEFGVKEPSIQLQGQDQIVVQLPGVTNRERTLELLKRTAVLEFKLVSADVDKISQAVAGNVPEGYELKESDKEPLLIEKAILLRGDTLVNADVKFDQSGFGQPIVSLKFNSEGARKFAQITSENVGRRLAIVLDGKVYSAPRINEAIPSGEAVITGRFSVEEAKDLALVLRVGSLPAPVVVAEERTVGPLLGKDSIDSGVRASIVGIALVFGFMILYYLFSGLITCVALLLNLLMILGYLGMFHVTLTLPGIAGIILTLGMAVDANVLINERIREELNIGRPLQTAVNFGYQKAFSAIFDSNLTTLIAAFFLFQFGTGPIRGFAVTLSVGLMASMFTSIVVTKVIFETIAHFNRNFKKLPMLQIFRPTNIDFVGLRNIFIVLSSLMVVFSIYLFIVKGNDAFGIDFAGGQIQEYSFDRPVAIEDLRNKFKEAGLSDASIQQFKDNAKQVIVKTSQDTSALVQGQFKKDFPDNNFQVLRIENVGPVVGRQLKNKAIWAILWSLLGILVYVAFRFKHFDFAVGGIIALIHDVIIATGILLLFNRQIDLLIITALLTLAGYSINDTIVIYDRIREITQKMHKAKLKDIINVAVNQTLSRTVLTSFATLLVVVSLFLFGGEVLNSFALVLLVGFIIGSYSTIFIATPLVFAFRRNK
ncbi:MAG: protein translocase subunit SecD [Candidatus Omnitrophica bacterium]|nr:protein translocase subunit SecD [Candidatus Omnitrophota bacterium]MDD5352590.1 protein translocase subunit SecD [Candidatus Omnitrophota bacterium]MDD5550188.1 protein translocase subunit SecD [Candidatus Omnitrophota bacterium]